MPGTGGLCVRLRQIREDNVSGCCSGAAIMTAPQDKGELEYGHILPNGEDWRLRKFDAGMGETEYRIFKNEKFFAMFDNREDADTVMAMTTHPTSAEQVLDAFDEIINRLQMADGEGYSDTRQPLIRLSQAMKIVDDIKTELRQQEQQPGKGA